jgi:predicted permease
MGLTRDILYSIRLLRKTPITTVVAIVSLATGIGANAAIFSLINALLLRPLPIRDPRSLVLLQTTGEQTVDSKDGLSVAMFQELRRSQKVFSGMFLWQGGGVDNFEVDGATYASSLETVSGDYFSTLGIRPMIGRPIVNGDVDLNGASAKVAVLGFRCWKERYHGDTDVIGKTIRINGTALTIIGVAPEEFGGLQIDIAPEAFVPIGYSGTKTYRDPENASFGVFGRLRAGLTIEQARAQLETVWSDARLAALPPSFQGGRRTEFLARRILIGSGTTGNSFLRRRMTRPLEVLMGLVAMLLFIACVNLANLMLARAAARLPEMSIRAALGSGLWRMARQLLVEALLLSAMGAFCGLVLAMWASRTLALVVWSGFVPLAIDTSPDWRVLAFTASVSIATGVVFGLAPLWILRRPEITRMLGQNSRSIHGGRKWIGQALVSAQISLSLVLLVGATMFSKSLANLYHQNPGFRRDGILLVQLYSQPGVRTIPNRSAYFRDLADRLAQIPGVRNVSFSHMGPATSYEFKESAASLDGSSSTRAIFEVVGPGFFNVVGMHVLAGRQFRWQDDENSRRVVMVSESLARQLFPGRNAVGQRIRIGLDPQLQALEVVGIVNSASLWMLQSHEPAAYFLPLLQQPLDNSETVNLRVDGDPLTAAPGVRKALAALGKQYALSTETLNHRTDRILVSQRVIAALSGVFAGIALLLGAIGLYGVMALSVTSRTPEMGLRMALGAQRKDVIVLILRQVLLTAGIGVAVGIPLTLLGASLIHGMIFGLPQRDTGTLLTAVSILVVAALIAGYLPARHAARVDPIETLRNN